MESDESFFPVTWLVVHLQQWGFAECCILYGTGHSTVQVAMVTFPLMWPKSQGRTFIPCPTELQHQHKAPAANPRVASQWDPLCALIGADLALITILLIAPSSIALLLSTGNIWPQLLLKWGALLGSLIKSAGRHLPIFTHNIFILIYWQHLEKLAFMQHQLNFIKIIRELS